MVAQGRRRGKGNMKSVERAIEDLAFDARRTDLYDSLAVQIERENQLINHRLTWTLQLNGFLFTSIALLTGKTIEDPGLALLIRWLIPVTGLCVSLAGCLGVMAAQWQIGYLIRHWQKHLQSDLRPRPFGASVARTSWVTCRACCRRLCCRLCGAY
jgi:hypothetical protein